MEAAGEAVQGLLRLPRIPQGVSAEEVGVRGLLHPQVAAELEQPQIERYVEADPSKTLMVQPERLMQISRGANC